MNDFISIKGAREHNLKNIDLKLPRQSLIVFTGLSGSGKSSLAFDTIYAEGQRRYVESLSAYARQFLDRMQKPDVDSIEGLSPAISIEQRVAGANPRSTVGTTTEIYDYLRLLYAKTGVAHCYRCGRAISRQSAQEIVDQIASSGRDTKVMILAPLVEGRKGEHRDLLKDVLKQGFARVRVDGQLRELSEKIELDKKKKHTIEIVVDRLQLKDDVKKRLTDSVEAALKAGKGTLKTVTEPGSQETVFSELHACVQCGISFQPLEPRLFSFNSPYGACPECDGLGSCLEVDPELVVPDKNKSLRQGAIAAWNRGGKSLFIYYRRLLRYLAERTGFSLDTPWKSLTKEQRELVLYGSEGAGLWDGFEGVIPNLERRFKETESEYMKEEIHKFMGLRPCTACRGKRLKPEALAVTVQGRSIMEVCALSIEEAERFFRELPLSKNDEIIARPILKEVRARLGFMTNVGLGYLSLDRMSGTLSGGEAQRIRLATQIGSGLMGVLYVLDEPSIGLHQRDNEKLLAALEALRDMGNTLIVVEHDESTMKAADWLVDLGPGAGKHGGRVVAAGRPEEVMKDPASVTGPYLTGQKGIPVPPARRRLSKKKIVIKGARENNLRSLDVEIPLGVLVCVTGVSGSGKSTLVDEILFKALSKKIYRSKTDPGKHDAVLGAEHLDKIIEIDQSPIGRTPRSNPATYTGLFGPIRDLFARLPEAKVRGYAPGRFSFNVKGGRCEACEGDGVKTIEMHFLPDVYVPCEVCKGRRFNEQTLEVRYKGRSIADVLAMSVEESLELFANVPAIHSKLRTLHDVGLDYIEIGQPATTLSGGEAQRIKLSTELSRRATGRTLYILDEPTTGLHFADIDRLLKVLHALVDQGNTVLVIEHNLDVIKTADHLIDLGPEGGSGGGRLVVSGTPEDVAAAEHSHTGRFLKSVLKKAVTVALALVLGLAAPGFAADNDRKDFAPAAQAFRDKLYDVSRLQAEQFLSRHADSSLRADAALLLGRSYLELGQYPRALEVLGALDSEEAGYWKAETYFRAKDFASAAREYGAFLERYPHSKLVPFAAYSRAWSRDELGEHEEAVELFLRFAAEHAQHPLAADARYKAGQALHSLKQYDAAVEQLSRLVRDVPLSPKVAGAWYLIGDSQYNLGETALALEAFKKSLELGPQSEFRAFALQGIGWSYFELGRYPEALQSFQPVETQLGNAALGDSFLFGQARALGKLGRHLEALEALDRLLADHPESLLTDQAMLWKAESLFALGRYADAASVNEEAIRRFPASPFLDDLQYNLAWTYARLGRTEEALNEFQVVADTGRDEVLRVSALCRVGDLWLEKGDTEKALETYDSVLQSYPKSIDSDYAQYQSAAALLRLGRADAAILSFKSLPVHFPSSRYADEALLGLGMALLQKGRPAEAEEAFAKLLAAFPESPLRDRAYFQQGNAAFNAQDTAKALAIFRDLAGSERSPDLARAAQAQVGWALLRAGRDEEALAALEDFIKRFPDSDETASVYFGLGEFFFERGSYEKAAERFRAVTERFASHPLADDAYYRLATSIERDGDSVGALDTYRRLARDLPRSEWAPKALLAASDIEVAQGRLEQARADAVQALALGPPGASAALARKKVGEILRAQGSFREAELSFREALGSADGELACEIQYALAETLEAAGENGKAASEYLKLTYLYPAHRIYNQRALAQAAKLYDQMGQTAEAEKIRAKIRDAGNPA